jgi:Fungal protein kinase
MKFQDTVLTELRHRYYTSADKVLRGSEADRKLDIFLSSASALPEGEHDWSNVLVIGEHKSNPNEDRSLKTLVQLAGYAREVFGSQPDRRFVPGFTICGSVMRLWVFDRSGSYSSENFDIHKEPERFVKVIAGYALMADAELGLNIFIKRDGNNKYIVAQEVKIYLEDKPIASTKAIVCRGTTCYRGRRIGLTEWEYVVKFAWPSDKRQREGRLLKLAKERGVTGIAVWFSHEQIIIDGHSDTIANLRRTMEFGVPRKLSSKALWVDNEMASSRTNSKTRTSLRSRSSVSLRKDLGISTGITSMSSSRPKRKREEGLDSGSGVIKRSKLAGSPTDVVNTDVEEHEPDIGDAYSIKVAETDSLAGCDSETYGNRVHCCLVSSPAGWPLHAYRSIRELLEAFRDAIKGHKSLLEDGKILHRDVSENNIIIVECPAEGDPKGKTD